MFYNIQNISSFNNILYLKDEILNYLNKYRNVSLYQYEFIIKFKLLEIVCLILEYKKKIQCYSWL